VSWQRGKVKKVVYFEAGVPVFALSNLAADRFGQFLVRVGKILPDQLQDVAVVAAQTGRRTGDVLVERGLLKDTERLYYVGQQVKSIIYPLAGRMGPTPCPAEGGANAEARHQPSQTHRPRGEALSRATGWASPSRTGWSPRQQSS
jgi:hypothetical protein